MDSKPVLPQPRRHPGLRPHPPPADRAYSHRRIHPATGYTSPPPLAPAFASSSLTCPRLLQDNIVWPAYLDAHAPLFLSGDVVSGAFDPTVISGATILEASQLSMEQMVNKACKEVFEHAKAGKEAR